MTTISDVITLSKNLPQDQASDQKTKISTKGKKSSGMTHSPPNPTKRSCRPMRSMMGIKSLRPKSIIKVESIAPKA